MGSVRWETHNGEGMNEIHMLLTIFLAGVVVGFLLQHVLGPKMKRAGKIVVTETEDRETFTLELEMDPYEIKEKKEVMFEIEVPESRE